MGEKLTIMHLSNKTRSWSVFSLCFFLLLTACDKSIHYDYYVENVSDDLIRVIFDDSNGKTENFQVPASEKTLIYQSGGLNLLNGDKVEFVFTRFLIIQGEDTSKTNYIDKDKWIFSILSDTEANFELIIPDSDFDD